RWLCAAPHREVRERRRAGRAGRRDLDLLLADVLAAGNARTECAVLAGMGRHVIDRAVLARDEDLGIAIGAVEDSVDRDAGTGRDGARDRRGRQTDGLVREHERATAVRVALRDADAESPARALGEDLGELRT